MPQFFVTYPEMFRSFKMDPNVCENFAKILICDPLDATPGLISAFTLSALSRWWDLLWTWGCRKWRLYRTFRYVLDENNKFYLSGELLAGNVLDFDICENYVYILHGDNLGITVYRVGSVWDRMYVDCHISGEVSSIMVKSYGSHTICVR